jgi:hypothetical protein
MKMNYIRKTFYAMLAAVAIIACSTEDLERADFVSFQGTSVDVEAPLTGTADNELNVFTTGKSGSERTFNILVDATSTADPASYTVPATVTVPANSNVGTFIVQAGAASIGKKIVLKFEPTDEVIVGTSMTVTINEQCLDNLLFLDILFDNYPEEFAWDIYDADDNFVAGNVNFGEYAGTANKKKQIRVRICLPDGDYSFTAYDQYGDGLSDGTNIGWFKLRRVSDGATIAEGEGDDFVDMDPVAFSLPE